MTSYERLLQAIRDHRGPVILSFSFRGEPEFWHRRILWALAETRWRRPCLMLDEANRPPGWWHLHDRYAPLPQAIDSLRAAPQPGRMAVLLGLEPEAIDLCARLLALGADAHRLCAELADAADPGVHIAVRLAALGQVCWEQVARGGATPPELRAFGHLPEVLAQRPAARADEALEQGDIAVALHWARQESPAEARRIQECARQLVASSMVAAEVARAPSRRFHLCLLNAAEDQGYAQELAQHLVLLDEVSAVSLLTDEDRGDILIVLISAALLADDLAFAVLEAAIKAQRPMVWVQLRRTDLQGLRDYLNMPAGMAVLPSEDQDVASSANLNDAWMEVLRGVVARLRAGA